MMKKAYLILPVLALAACQSEPKLPAVNQPAESAIVGLATPVQLRGTGVTEVHLGDYINPEKIDSFYLPAEVSASNIDPDQRIIGIEPEPTLGMETFMRVFADGQPYDIIIHRSRKVPVEVRIPADLFDGTVTIFGSFNAWNRTSDTMVLEGDDLVYRSEFQPGVQEYKFFVNDVEYTDPNAEQVSNGMGGFNSVLEVKPRGEKPEPIRAIGYEEGTVYLNALPESQDLKVLWDNQLLPEEYIHHGADSIAVRIPSNAAQINRSTLRFFSSNEAEWARELRIPLAAGKPIMNAQNVKRQDWSSARMYFIMIDRFANGDTANDEPLNDPEVLPQCDYRGGDIAGVLEKLREGYFDKLGVNTIWLSPITQNPTDAWGLWDKGGVRTKFSGYHGYWPISNTQIDYRFGDPEVLKTLIDEAHAKGYNVLLDYVANHVHQSHPIYQEHPEWATDLYLPDGSLNTERWDDHRLTTWFDNHLPTLDLRKPEVVEPMTDSALVWLTDFEFDGFRHDATKHIDLIFWRTLTHKVHERVNRPIYQIGETYGSAELIASYLSTGMLNAQFDFNAYDAILNVIADESIPMERVVDVMNASWDWYGQHNTMGYISGNQDRSRFISIASGDVLLSEDQKLAGYTRDIGKPQSTAYQQLLLLHVFNHSIPGIPVIYYGDEYGSPGANDPDNRRMMKFGELDSDEKSLRDEVSVLEDVRASEMALIYGSAEIEAISESLLHIRREYLGTTIDIYINRSKDAVEIPAEAGAEVLFGQELENNMLPALSAIMLKKS
ncbi:alpha-amylase [Phaeocystidibacter luteus]|uniref:Alpha-amylase n=2 Tax=Phaeocystidibacter luteus TaxID=911197 RepID=A0A6N6RJI5_9FLAO|nr:alpha-amylase [Phaeocystidibacter luteus]